MKLYILLVVYVAKSEEDQGLQVWALIVMAIKGAAALSPQRVCMVSLLVKDLMQSLQKLLFHINTTQKLGILMISSSK